MRRVKAKAMLVNATSTRKVGKPRNSNVRRTHQSGLGALAAKVEEIKLDM